MNRKAIPDSEMIINSDGSIFHLHLLPEHLADNIIGSLPDTEELIESARPLVRLQGFNGELKPELSAFSWNRK